MTDPTMISMFVGAGVILLLGGATLVLTKSLGSVAEERLAGLSGGRAAKVDPAAGILLRPAALDLGTAPFWSRVLPNPENLNKLYDQADISMPFNRFMAMAGVFTLVGFTIPVGFQQNLLFAPVCGAF